MKLVDRKHYAVEGSGCKRVEREPQSRVRANQHRLRAVQELDERADLALRGAGITQIVVWLDLPVGEETESRETRRGEGRADRPLRHSDDDLLSALVVELVKGHEHQRAG